MAAGPAVDRHAELTALLTFGCVTGAAEVAAVVDGPGSLDLHRPAPLHVVTSVLVTTADGAWILLGRHADDDWGPLGGHVEADDATLRAAAAREVAEESGLLLNATAFVPVSALHYRARCAPGAEHLDVTFRVTAPRVPVVAADDIVGLAWFELADLPAIGNPLVLGLVSSLMRS